MELLWPLMGIVFLSNLTEAVAGFGATLIAVGLGAQFIPIEDLIPILVPLNVLLSLVIVIRYANHVQKKELLTRILPLAGLGLPIGLLIFQMAPGRTLQQAFGAVIACLGFYEVLKALYRARTGRDIPTATRWTFVQSFGLLVAGGIMQGLYSSGGPFVVYYASRTIPNKTEFRSTLSMLWLILNILVTLTLAYTGKINAYTLRYSFGLLAPVLIGMIAGMKIHDRVSERHFRLGVYALLAVAGLSLLLRA